MAWLVRALEDNGAYLPSETPCYSNADGYFSLKFHHGGEMRSYPHMYVGGSVRYADNCDGDLISMIEVMAMLDECGDIGRDCDLYYRKPDVEMEYGMNPLQNDDDVMTMCKLVPQSRLIEVYVIKQKPLSQPIEDYFPSPDPDYEFIPDDPVRLEWERRQAETLLMFEGLFPDFPTLVDAAVVNEGRLEDVNVVEEGREIDQVIQEGSDVERASFHGDSSNLDSTDNEVCTILLDSMKSQPPIADNNVDDDDDSVSDFSEQGGSEDEAMAGNSTDEEESKYPIFNEAIDMADPQFQLGLLFSSAAVFRAAVKKNAILNRRPIKRVRNWGTRAKYVCEGEGCKWKIYASEMQYSKTFQVKRYLGKHSCSPTFTNLQINSAWIAKQYENDIRLNPKWPLSSFHKKVVNDWKCDVSIYSIGRAKRKALANINGSHVEQYGLMCAYVKEIKKSMPDSTIELVLDELEAGQTRRRFKRIYICLGPLKKGFRSGCRPLIGLDGCHLKGPYGGQLLSAVATDGNDGMYPIAWAVVEVENTETWNWFLQLLSEDVGIENLHAWTFISDRQKGLINALETVVPNAEHRFCVMHLYRNMWKDHKGIGLRKYLWLAVRATTDYMFDKHMAEIKKMSKKCYEWIMEKPKSQWTRCAFRVSSMSDMFVNNHCEAFNKSIKDFRDLPVLKMLQCIHLSVMKRIQKRRDKMLKTDTLNPICPNAMRKVNKALSYTGGCEPAWSGGSQYHVTMLDSGHEIVLDLQQKTCACRKYQLTGLPCYHVAACIKWRGLNMHAHIHPAYSKDMFLECYKHTLNPIPSEEFWDKEGHPQPLPPPKKKAPGRPKKKRIATTDIPKTATVLRRRYTSMNCKYCTVIGHNSRTCAAKKADIARGIYRATATGSATTNPTTSSNANAEASNPVSPEATKQKAKRAKKKAVVELQQDSPATIVTDEQRNAHLAATTIAEGSTQAGIFSSYAEQRIVPNTALGIQPTRFSATSNIQVTTLTQLQAAKSARKPPPKPMWKL